MARVSSRRTVMHPAVEVLALDLDHPQEAGQHLERLPATAG